VRAVPRHRGYAAARSTSSSRAASPPRVLRIGVGRAFGGKRLRRRSSPDGTVARGGAGRIRAAVSACAEEVGVALDTLAVRDLMVPAELRRAAAEVATARAQGQTALERARAEVAATRALGNAARMVAEQPALLQLRTLQAVEAGGATVVLTTAPGQETVARPAP